jgi:hypothetical protein
MMEKLPDRLVKLALAQDPTTDESTLAELSKILDEQILCAVASNPNTSPSTLAALQSDPPIFFDDENPDGTEFDAIFRCLVDNPNTPEQVLVNLANNSYVCYYLAKSPHTPIYILNKFVNWENFGMWRSLVSNLALPSSVLERLAAVDARDIRQEVLNHPNVSPDAMAIVDFMDGSSNVPIHIFEKLAIDNRLHVLKALARCPQTPSPALDVIIASTAIESYKLIDIYKIVVTNPNASSGLLEKVAPQLVEKYNQQHYNSWTPNELYEALKAILSHANITSKVIESISFPGLQAGGLHDLPQEIAKNLQTPSSAIDRLMQDLPPFALSVYTALANHPNTSPESLRRKIQQLINTRHPNSIHAIRNLIKSPNITSEFLEELFNDRLPDRDYLRDIVREHPNCPPYLRDS